MEYKVAIHRNDHGISVSVPALPGCWSEGNTEEEALANIQDAIRDYLAALDDCFKGAETRELEVRVLVMSKIPGVNHLDAVRALE